MREMIVGLIRTGLFCSYYLFFELSTRAIRNLEGYFSLIAPWNNSYEGNKPILAKIRSVDYEK